MTAIFIAFKDLSRSLRSPFVLAFMIVLPVLQAGLPYLAFSGLSSGLDVQVTHVQIVNLDRPVPEYPDFNAGSLLVEMFRDEELRDLLDVTEVDSESSACAAVDGRQVDVALIIPPDFTAALFRDDGHATVVIYHDPALTLGPGIVRDVVTNFTDGFAGSLMAAEVAETRAAAQGKQLDEATRLEVMRAYGDWALTIGDSLKKGVHPAIRYEASPDVQKGELVMKSMIGPIMLGMMIFFTFFVGVISAQSILRELEQGTLARLYRTPASRRSILAGKFGAVLILLAIQVMLLLGIGSLIFGIHWGVPIPIVANGVGLVVSAAGFGVMLISFMRSTRQAFLILGGAVILTSMAGGTMTTSFSNLPPLFKIINLFTPQGWVLHGFTAAMRSGNPADTILPAAVAVMVGLVTLFIGSFNMSYKFT
jgi:ABC-type transport system involved in multi-copper enzyme maturation permease subunit